MTKLDRNRLTSSDLRPDSISQISATKMETVLQDLVTSLKKAATYFNGDGKETLQAALHNAETLPDKQLWSQATEALDLLEQLRLSLEPGHLVLADHFMGSSSAPFSSFPPPFQVGTNNQMAITQDICPQRPSSQPPIFPFPTFSPSPALSPSPNLSDAATPTRPASLKSSEPFAIMAYLVTTPSQKRTPITMSRLCFSKITGRNGETG